MLYGDLCGWGRRKNKANGRALPGNPKLEILNPKQYQMFKILNFQDKTTTKTRENPLNSAESTTK